MQNLLKNIENITNDYSISHIYIKDGKLRATYHIENPYISLWNKSDYYNNKDEIIDQIWISQILDLDFREKDYTDTLEVSGYFLVWETQDFIPAYLQKFLIDFHNMILSPQFKKIKRTKKDSYLLYLKLNILPRKDIWDKEFSQKIQNILKK